MKYRNQSPTVLSHLHLFALQKAIYLSLNQNAILWDVISKDSSLRNDEYKQAWKIVNKEGHVSFINELKKYQINTRNFAQDKISARSRLRKLRSSCLEG